jgi:hypothetical protein
MPADMMENERKEQLMKSLPDNFSRELLTGSLRVAADQENPVRGNLFAAGMRELLSHSLHAFAPDSEVEETPWFELEVGTDKITRRQRIRFATQRGIADAFMESIGVDITALQNSLRDAFRALNRATHVRPGRTISSDGDVQALIDETGTALVDFLQTYETNLELLQEELAGNVYQAIMGEFVERTFADIDIVAGAGYEVDPLSPINEIVIDDITATSITVRASGEASVTLQYGSGEDAAEIGHDFPFWMQFSAPVETPRNLRLVDYEIDNCGWFGDAESD